MKILWECVRMRRKIFTSAFISSVWFVIILCGCFSFAAKADDGYTSLPKKPEVLVNIHIGRTGASTINAIISKHYNELTGGAVNCVMQPEQSYPLMAIRKIQEDFYTRLSSKQKSQLRTVGGHVGAEVLNFFPKDLNVKAFAIVRDPRGLIISQFWEAWKGLDDKQKADLNVSELDRSLISFITRNNYNNDITRWFSRNNKFYDHNVPLTEEEFEEIKNNIQKNFLFVGLFHRFDETVIALRRLMGWPFDKSLFYKVKNKAEFKMPEDSYPASILKNVKARFSFDQQLYSWLEQRFNSLTRLLGEDFDEEVRIFKRLEYLYQADHPIFEAQLRKVQETYTWAKQK